MFGEIGFNNGFVLGFDFPDKEEYEKYGMKFAVTFYIGPIFVGVAWYNE